MQRATSAEMVEKIKIELQRGKKQKDISKNLKVNISVVNRVANGHRNPKNKFFFDWKDFRI
jgi:transcriptional regulator with XRE-family HTH domain